MILSPRNDQLCIVIIVKGHLTPEKSIMMESKRTGIKIPSEKIGKRPIRVFSSYSKTKLVDLIGIWLLQSTASQVPAGSCRFMHLWQFWSGPGPMETADLKQRFLNFLLCNITIIVLILNITALLNISYQISLEECCRFKSENPAYSLFFSSVQMVPRPAHQV